MWLYAVAGAALALVTISAGVKTWVGELNFLLLQWFGVRLQRSRPNECARNGCRRHDTYKLIRWIWPLTGWWTEYRYIARRP